MVQFNSFLSSIATDSKDGHGLKHDWKRGASFFHVLLLLTERLRFTFTPNDKRQIKVENFSENKQIKTVQNNSYV